MPFVQWEGRVLGTVAAIVVLFVSTSLLTWTVKIPAKTKSDLEHAYSDIVSASGSVQGTRHRAVHILHPEPESNSDLMRMQILNFSGLLEQEDGDEQHEAAPNCKGVSGKPYGEKMCLGGPTDTFDTSNKPPSLSGRKRKSESYCCVCMAGKCTSKFGSDAEGVLGTNLCAYSLEIGIGDKIRNSKWIARGPLPRSAENTWKNSPECKAWYEQCVNEGVDCTKPGPKLGSQ